MAEVPSGETEIGFGLKRSVRVLVVDDILLTRLGAAEILGRTTWLESVRTCAGLEESVAELEADAADVVLVNVATIDIGEAMRALAAPTGVALVAFGVAEEPADMLRCVELGVAGFVLRSASVDIMLEVLASVAAGKLQCPPEVVPLLLQRMAAAATAPAGESVLTSREREVLRLVERGMSNKDIAIVLGIKSHTVKNHLHHVYDKLRVSTRGEAAAKARAVRDAAANRRRSDPANAGPPR